MHENPSAAELVAAVRGFISDTAGPQLTGHAAFHARIAVNALDIVLRDLEAREENTKAETESLAALLGENPATADHERLTQLLCDILKASEMTIHTPGLLEHLKSTAIAQLKVDQPAYSGLEEALRSK